MITRLLLLDMFNQSINQIFVEDTIVRREREIMTMITIPLKNMMMATTRMMIMTMIMMLMVQKATGYLIKVSLIVIVRAYGNELNTPSIASLDVCKLLSAD